MEMPDVIYVLDGKSDNYDGVWDTYQWSDRSGEEYHHSSVVEALQEENAELKEKLAKTEWQPIETAPNGKVRLWWKDEDWKGYMSDEIDQRGNRVWYVYTGKNCIMAADPTHWMPLQEPPTTEETK